jgi:hypothetical protein
MMGEQSKGYGVLIYYRRILITVPRVFASPKVRGKRYAIFASWGFNIAVSPKLLILYNKIERQRRK